MFKLLKSNAIFKISYSCRFVNTVANNSKAIEKLSTSPERIRNIGIIAHIDAGKTTTTERMLFYSGVINNLGEVHKGDTVMDYMEQEIARGITITSAAISFPWRKHRINLIDTPGHVDFTFEVERSLSILDGVIAILDASVGIEAQTLTVWKQANKYNIPKIVYLNKMDKSTANIDMCIHQLKTKLHCSPILLQLPLGYGPEFRGVIDLIDLKVKKWEVERNPVGRMFTAEPIFVDNNPDIYDAALNYRNEMIERLADLDEEFTDLVLSKDNLDEINESEIKSALRRVILKGRGTAVLCGSSYKNIGVQLLMDAIICYLPNPQENLPEFVECYSATNNMCALAFKIQNNLQLGPLTYLRIYSGQIETGQKIYNVSKNTSEKVGRLYVASADELTEIATIPEGNIVVATGLKDVSTGDTLTSGLSAANAARYWLAKERGVVEAEVTPVLFGVQVPDPVYFCSIEPRSLMFQKPLEKALALLQKEDPSCKVSFDSDTGQTVIAGMGELHLEILLDRIRTEYGVDASLGHLQVAYKETTLANSKDSYTLEKLLSGVKHFVKITAAVESDLTVQSTPPLEYACSKESREQLATVWPIHLKAAEKGLYNALTAGPLIGFPVTGIRIILHALEVGPRTSETMVTAAAAQCITQLLRSGGTRLMEPFMKLEIIVEEHHLNAVLNDLAQHRSDILEISQRQQWKVILAECPSAELRGYSTRIRILTSGTGTFSMEFSAYKLMMPQDQQNALREITGIV